MLCIRRYGSEPEIDEDEEAGVSNAARDKIYDKGQSRRIWGELYKVVDSSDVVVQVLSFIKRHTCLCYNSIKSIAVLAKAVAADMVELYCMALLQECPAHLTLQSDFLLPHTCQRCVSCCCCCKPSRLAPMQYWDEWCMCCWP